MPPLLVNFNDVLRVVEVDVESEGVEPVLFKTIPQLAGVLRVGGVDRAFGFEDDIRWRIGDVPYGSAESMSLVDQPCVDSCHDGDDTDGTTRSDGSLVGMRDLDLVSRSRVDAHQTQEA